jgi:hypothetical protein
VEPVPDDPIEEEDEEDEPDDRELEEEEEDREAPRRLVDARIAEDMLELPEPEADAAEEVLTGPVLEPTDKVGGADADCTLPRSRPAPDRLPLICGTIIETDRSAEVEPVSRTIFATVPRAAAAVRVVRAAAARPASPARFCQRYTPAATAAIRHSAAIHPSRLRRGSGARLVTTEGVLGEGWLRGGTVLLDWGCMPGPVIVFLAAARAGTYYSVPRKRRRPESES